MRTLSFKDSDILNTTLVSSDDAEATYTIKTASMGGEKVTTLNGTSPAASIHWGEQITFAVGDESIPVKAAEREVWVKGRYTSARIWSWGKWEYELDYANGGWTVKDVLSDSTVAYLRSAQSHIVHKNEPAQLAVNPDISPAGFAFLLLAIVYSEWRRLKVMVSRNLGSATCMRFLLTWVY
ncbi:hypothetical protein HDZ31DRAFT_40302 [Schizophyllum fasciatum]